MSALNIPCYAYTARHASRHLSQFYESFIGQSGIHSQQFTILAIIKHKAPLTVSALADELTMDRTTLTRSLRPIERDGNIAISNEEKDRRNKIITITDQGREQLEIAVKKWHQAQAEFESRFGVERAERLREELRAAAAVVNR